VTIFGGGEGVLKVVQDEMIRTAHRVYDKSISELAQMMAHARNTVKKAIRGELWGYKERGHHCRPTSGGGGSFLRG